MHWWELLHLNLFVFYICNANLFFRASGHVDRFADLMVKDTVNGECFRLDHLIKSHLEKVCADKKTTAETINKCENILTKVSKIHFWSSLSVLAEIFKFILYIQLDGLNKEELQNILTEFDIKSPLTGNKLSEPIEFNLMFATHIGPTGLIKG